MSKVAKFVVIVIENASWMEKQSLSFYSNLLGNSLGEKYANENLSFDEFIRIQNDFLIEVLMIYDGETPLSFSKLNSSRIFDQELNAKKPIGLEHIIYKSTEDLQLLCKRGEEVAKQRRHDLIWIKTLDEDLVMKEILISNGYEEFKLEETIDNVSQLKEVYFMKDII